VAGTVRPGVAPGAGPAVPPGASPKFHGPLVRG